MWECAQESIFFYFSFAVKYNSKLKLYVTHLQAWNCSTQSTKFTYFLEDVHDYIFPNCCSGNERNKLSCVPSILSHNPTRQTTRKWLITARIRIFSSFSAFARFSEVWFPFFILTGDGTRYPCLPVCSVCCVINHVAERILNGSPFHASDIACLLVCGALLCSFRRLLALFSLRSWFPCSRQQNVIGLRFLERKWYRKRYKVVMTFPVASCTKKGGI